MKTTHYILLLFLITSISPLFSTTYYVSNAGSNSNNGLSPGNAFLTIQFATNLVVAGDSVLVADGTYAGFDHRGESGTASDPIVYLANGKDVFITSKGPLRNDGINIEGTSGNELEYIEINGFNIIGIPNNGNGVRLVYADFCIVRNCNSDANYRGIFTGFTDNILIENNYCANSYGEHGIYLSNSSDDAIIRYNICFNNINIGIHMNGDASAGEDGIIHKPILYGNTIYENNQAAGINMDGVFDALIFNNLIYDNHFGSGITIFQDDGGIMSQAARIYNNTIIVPSDGRWGINMYNGAQFNTILKNNIIVTYHSSKGVLALLDTMGFESNYNVLQDKISVDGDDPSEILPEGIWQEVYLFDTNSIMLESTIEIEELFEDMPMGNFNLAMNSIAVDAGTDEIDDVVLNDILGGGRPSGVSYDIGAFERGAILAIDDVSDLWLNGVNASIAVSWKAKTENKITDFFVERSADGLTWENVSQVPFIQKKENYRILDDQPYNGTNYYRIKSMDPNGEYFYSIIRSIEFEVVQKMRLFPNPSNGLILSDSHDDNIIMEVFDMLGRKLARKEGWSGYWESGLTPGIYYFAWKNKGRSFIEKMVIE